NGRGTVTVLAVDNSSLSSISGRPKESIKAIISTHIVLDYFDEKKLNNLEDDEAQLTTLYQSSGKAQKLQGFINVVQSDNDEIIFGSAVQGAPLNAKLIETVTTQ
ncbi:hypothetical protein MLE29_10800, partial [Pasteurella multocida]|uniref:hypothetical protein n=1 Tax=Pasteurella multocida TaxID=747 RepID=UPI001F0D6C16